MTRYMWTMALGVLTYLFFGIGDGISTVFALSRVGWAHETSPIFGPLALPPWAFLVLKNAAVIAIIGGLVYAESKAPTFSKCMLVAMAVVGAFITISNLDVYYNAHSLYPLGLRADEVCTGLIVGLGSVGILIDAWRDKARWLAEIRRVTYAL